MVDVVWPSQHYAFADMLPAIIEVASARSDVLSIRGRVGLDVAIVSWECEACPFRPRRAT